MQPCFIGTWFLAIIYRHSLCQIENNYTFASYMKFLAYNWKKRHTNYLKFINLELCLYPSKWTVPSMFFDRKKHCMGFEWVITLNIWKFWSKTTDQCCWETCGTLERRACKAHTEGLDCLLSASITTCALWIHTL